MKRAWNLQYQVLLDPPQHTLFIAMALLFCLCFRCHRQHFRLQYYQDAAAEETNFVGYHQYEPQDSHLGAIVFWGIDNGPLKGHMMLWETKIFTAWSIKRNRNPVSTWGQCSDNFLSVIMLVVIVFNNDMRRWELLDISRNLDPWPFQWWCDSQILSYASTSVITTEEDAFVKILH